MINILQAVIWFAALGGVFGIILAFAGKAFAVKTDPKIEAVREKLPGANCGGCGYAGCDALAAAVASGEAKPNACKAVDFEKVKEIAAIVGVEQEQKIKMRAQVMCSGSDTVAKKKYIYNGINDCVAANKLGGGSKLCPNGCIGYGTCIRSCKFDAITVVDGLAVIDPKKCVGCGNCVSVCPKGIIKLIPADAKYYVVCMSIEKGADARIYCDVGCIGCKKCERNCPANAVICTDNLAKIEYALCVQCGKCANECPRKIISGVKSE